ncbi:type VI secretion system baseplate subunit TssK [Pseudoxanthomonas kalamensis DSM 18571]|uniref:type VI secretion system baseplate subunit TssK n=1 Tax=Pseudoxanthomonas kalamensis TaxID=289483 RepID=UPI0013916C73|nr:type VI secretion system baseplate subunit TssK [Pseudoxanthomonas kalamensis]KAF1712644.1 type VI secretion system baseplate subunit TssK [Pseudoxanthomonas kalamensis DSM 18571]
MSKIFWGEGLFLRPQHFQQQDAYHETRLRDTAATLHPYAWGLRDCSFDLQSLASGVLRLLRLSAVFPDGEPYSAPQDDELPEPLSLAELPAGVSATTIHLAVPLLRPHGGNCGTDPDGASRFVQANRVTPDLYTDAAEAELGYLRKTVRLLTDDDARDAFSALPIARVRRTPTGGFELDADFVPPCLSIAAVPALMLDLRRLLDALQAKTDALYGIHREPSQHIVEFRSGDIASFWLLHTANAAHAALSHLYHHPGLAPERLFQELSRLVGGLMTFSKAYRLADLPRYQHAAPQAGFDTLFAMIRELLDTVISERYFSINLSEVKPSFHLGRIDSQRIDARSAFYLGVAADLPGNELAQSVPVRFKVGAPDDVDKCVLSALPGVKLTHAAQVPAAIPVRPGSQYFALEPHGPLYERMLKSESITIYVPSGIRELKLELIALTQ